VPFLAVVQGGIFLRKMPLGGCRSEVEQLWNRCRRNWRTWFVVGALLLGACGLGCAQEPPADPEFHSVEIQAPPSGSLAGRLTDLHSAPLAGVPVVLRNQATGVELRAVTGKNGVFRFAALDTGEYTLEADAPQLGHGELEGILVTGGAEARLQAAMHFEPVAPGVVEASAPLEIVAPQPPAVSMPVTAFAAPAASAPPPPTAARAPSSASRLETVAPASTGPPISTAPRAAAAVAPPNPPAAPQPAVRAESLSALPSLPLQATLETPPIPAAPALASALPRTLPLARGTAQPLPFSAAIASGVKAILLSGPKAFSPVAAAAHKADPGAAPVTTTLTAAQLASLPAGGRRWQEFLLDTPAASASSSSSQASYRGSLESAEITIDGANTSLKFGVAAGSSAGSTAQDPASQGEDRQNTISQSMSQSWTGGRGFGVSEAAIQEVTAVAGNVAAEGMRSAGGETGIETQRGGNALHGQGFYYDRQNNWGARNPFTQWVTETSEFAPLAPFNTTALFPVFDNFQYSSGQNGLPESYTPPDHEIVWGIGMGSRIRRDKLFWFGAMDSYHRNDPGLAMVKHPYLQTSCETSPCPPTGFFASPSDAQLQLLSLQLDLSSANPAVEGLTAYSQMLRNLASLLAPAPRTAAQWMGFARIDWQATERHRFTLEGVGANWNAPGGGLTRVSENYGSNSFGSSHASQQWLLARWEAYLTPNLLSVTQTSAGRTVLTARPDAPSAFEQAFLSGNSYGQLPQIIVDSSYGFSIGNPARFGQGSYPDEKLYHAQQMLDWVHGRLLVKAGFELDHNADATSLLRNQTGTYHYSTVASFISDALAFEKYRFADALDPANAHNCDATGHPWYASNGQLMGLGAMPCYSSFSQMMGPTNWRLSTNDWAGYATAQWQASKFAVFSAGLRWEREQLPPPLANLDNPELPFTQKLPSLGNNWAPRVSLALGSGKSRWPVLRLGYGMYYGHVENSTIETALTQTGSFKGDLSFFMRPQDDCQYCAGGSPPFPHVLSGEPASVVKPGAVGFAPGFRNPEVHQALASLEQKLPGGVALTATAMMSLGRRLPVAIDTNVNTTMSSTVNLGITYDVCDEVTPGANNGTCGNLSLGPIKNKQITIPYFYASWPGSKDTGTCPYYTPTSGDVLLGRLCPDYQAITQITSKANSTYEAAMLKLVRYGRHGLSFHAHYIYAHAADWNPDGVTLAPESDVLDPNPANFKQEYGASNQEVRHSAAAMVIFESPWKLHDKAGRFANGWMLSGIGQFHSGFPYSMRITGSLPEEFTKSGAVITGLGPSLNGYGGDDRYPGLPRNSFRYPDTWKADMRLGKRFDLGEMRQLELLAESFNLFNHENVTEIETTGYFIGNGSPPSALGGSATQPTLNFLTGLYVNPKTGLVSPAFGQPLNINGTNFYRERQIQFGLTMRF
jgi:hypothetical protein